MSNFYNPFSSLFQELCNVQCLGRNSCSLEWVFRHELYCSHSLYVYSREQAWKHFIIILHMKLCGGNMITQSW